MRFGYALLIAVILLSALPVEPQGNDFTNIKVSTDDFFPHQVEPTMALGNDNEIFVGYKEAQAHNGGGFAVSFTVSLDGGTTWKSPQLMPSMYTQNARQSDPWMVYRNGVLYYAYLDFTSIDVDPQLNSRITIAMSKDQGNSWSTVKASQNEGFADKETFDVDDKGNIYVAYDDVGAIPQSYPSLVRSFDGGKSFIENTTWSDIPTQEYVGPYIIAGEKPGKLYIAWTVISSNSSNNDILFDFSDDYGNTWHSDTEPNKLWNASRFTTVDNAPSIVSLPVIEQGDDQRLWLLWDDVNPNNNFNVWLTYSDDLGKTWIDPLMVNHNEGGHQWSPDMEIDGQGNAHIVYYDNSTGNYDVYYRVYNKALNKLSDPVKVSHKSTSGSFTRPGEYMSVRIDKDGYTHIVWADGRDGNMDIYYGKSNFIMSERLFATNSANTTTSISPLELHYLLIPLLAKHRLQKRSKLKHRN